MSEETKKAFSRCDEDFCFSERSDVLEDMAADDALVEGAVYYEADCESIKPTLFDHCVDGLLEQMQEDLFDEVGEVADCDFTDVGSEAKDELVGLVRAWITKHVDVIRYFRIVGKSRKCVVTAEDVAEHLAQA